MINKRPRLDLDQAIGDGLQRDNLGYQLTRFNKFVTASREHLTAGISKRCRNLNEPSVHPRNLPYSTSYGRNGRITLPISLDPSHSKCLQNEKSFIGSISSGQNRTIVTDLQSALTRTDPNSWRRSTDTSRPDGGFKAMLHRHLLCWFYQKGQTEFAPLWTPETATTTPSRTSPHFPIRI